MRGSPARVRPAVRARAQQPRPGWTDAPPAVSSRAAGNTSPGRRVAGAAGAGRDGGRADRGCGPDRDPAVAMAWADHFPIAVLALLERRGLAGGSRTAIRCSARTDGIRFSAAGMNEVCVVSGFLRRSVSSGFMNARWLDARRGVACAAPSPPGLAGEALSTPEDPAVAAGPLVAMPILLVAEPRTRRPHPACSSPRPSSSGLRRSSPAPRARCSPGTRATKDGSCLASTSGTWTCPVSTVPPQPRPSRPRSPSTRAGSSSAPRTATSRSPTRPSAGGRRSTPWLMRRCRRAVRAPWPSAPWDRSASPWTAPRSSPGCPLTRGR